jgi:spermidine synthase
MKPGLNESKGLAFYLLVIGFISILGQVVILRELNVAFYGIDLIYIIALGIWLLGTAAGTIIGKYFFYKSPHSLKVFFLVWGILLPVEILFIRSSRIIFGGVPGAYLQFFSQVAALFIAVLPVSILPGIMFQHAAGNYIKEKNSLAKAYAVESAGGLAGGLLSTLLLIQGVQNLNSAFICSLVSFIPVLFFSLIMKEKPFALLTSFLVLLIVILSCFSSSIDYFMTNLNYPYLTETIDTPYSRVSVTSDGGQISVFENDALSFETESTAAEEFVHMVLTQHKDPKSVLLIGGGIEGTIYELLKYDSLKIDYVELNEKLIGAVRKYLPYEINKSFQSKRLNLIFADPRNYLNSCGNYDVILVGMPEPSSLQTNRFYTKEFFELCSKHLNIDGIIAMKLKSAENLWTPQLTNRNASIYNALKLVFYDVIALPGSTCIFTASNSVLEKDPAILAARFKDRNISTKYVIPEYIKYVYTNDRFFQTANILAGSNSQINSDFQPVCFQYTTAIWLSKFFPDINRFDFSAVYENIKGHKIYLIFIMVLFAFFLIFIKYRTSFSGTLLVFFAGFTGMVLETMSILNYQSVSGVLFQNIGLLLTAFMAGLALGAAFINRLYHRHFNRNLFRLTGLGFILALGIMNYLFGFYIKGNLLAGLPGTSLILFCTGFLVSGIFAFASFFNVKVQQDTISSLYSADLIGGCAGSLISSLILIPTLGMFTTGTLMGIILLPYCCLLAL